MASQAQITGKGLQDTIATLQDVIKSQQEKGKEHEPTPTEYFALISTTISVGSGGDRLPELLKVLLAVIPSTSKAIVKVQFKPLCQSLLTILKVNAENDTLSHTALSVLGAMMQEQENSDGFWSALHALQCINAVLSFADSDSSKIRKLSHDILIALMRSHQLSKTTAVRGYIADFCVGVILSCSRAIYKRTHCVILLLENVLSFVPEDKLQPLLEFSLRLQLCEIPKLTAAVYRMFDTTFQSPYYAFTANGTLQAVHLLLTSRPATADMESNTYFCTALASGLLCLRKQDRAALLTGVPAMTSPLAGAAAGAVPAVAATVGPQGNLMNKVTAALINMCESDFVQVHLAVSTALKRILCTLFERRTTATITQLMQNGLAAFEETQLAGLLTHIAALFQLKYKQAWLYILDTTRSLFDLFKHNGRPVKMLSKVVVSLAEVYQAIEHGVLVDVPSNVHISLTETLGAAVRTCGLKYFLEIVPLADDNGMISASKDWIINILHSNLKHMTCSLTDFGTCILPLANNYYKLIQGSDGSTNVVELKTYRARITQLWSLLPELCAHNVKDIADAFNKMSPILERLFSDYEFPELLTYVVGALYQLAKGVRERCPRVAAGATEVVTPELSVLRASAHKYLPLILQYVEGISIGEGRFQEGVQCIAAWSEIAPSALVAAVSKKLLQLVLTSTAVGGSESRENVAAAGWMAVMLAIIPLLPEALVQLLFKSIRPLLTVTEVSSVQKRAYGLLLSLLAEHRDVVLRMEPPLQMLRAVSEALLTCHVSSRSMRLQCIRALMTTMSVADLQEALALVHKEVLICQKDANKKSRDAAMDILKFFIQRLDADVVLKVLTDTLSSAAGPSVNATSVLKSSAVTALCLLLLQHRSRPAMLRAGVELLPQVGELLVADCPHQSKAVLSYLRVFVSIQPTATVTNEALLPSVVSAFTQSLGTHKAKFAPRCRAIMRKLTHRIGDEALRAVVPPSDQPLLDYVCKHARRFVINFFLRITILKFRSDFVFLHLEFVNRAKRRKDQQKEAQQSSREERMLGSDSDTDDSDGENDDDEDDEDMQSSGPSSSSSSSQGPGGSVMRQITQNLVKGVQNQEDYRLGKRPKAMRVGDAGRSVLPSSLDDLLDDQPSLRQTMRGESFNSGAGSKRARSDFDDSAGASNSGRGKAVRKAADEDNFNVVVTADGKVVVKEVEEVEEPEVAAKIVRGKRVTEEGTDGTDNPTEQRPESAQKRRKLTLKEPGEEYRAKKAGGDVWKKGMLAPHAFIPLDPRLLSKKHRAQAIDHFGVVVKGGNNKKASALRAQKKGGKKGEERERHSRNRPHQKKHK